MDDQPGGQGWFGALYGDYGPAGVPCNSTSNALEIVRVVKSGAGVLFGFSGFSNAGASQFILGFDKLPDNTATGLTNAEVPVLVVTVPAASNFSYDAGNWGRPFSRGMILACSSTAATLTLGTATVWLDAQYV